MTKVLIHTADEASRTDKNCIFASDGNGGSGVGKGTASAGAKGMGFRVKGTGFSSYILSFKETSGLYSS